MSSRRSSTDSRPATRRRPRPVYTDVTDCGQQAPHQDLVRSLQELGFDVLGLVTLDLEPGGYQELAAEYGPDERDEMLAHALDPATVLRSADGTVQGQVAWFWSEPSVQLRTWMSDGSLVETHRRWAVVPPWPVRRAGAWRHATIEGEMTRQAAEGRSVATVPTRDPARLVEAHRAHVRAYAETYGCTPVAAPSSMAEVLAGLERATVHMWRVGEVWARTFNALVMATVLVTVLVSWLLTVAGLGRLAAWCVVVPLVIVATVNRSSVRFAYTRWWRPAYR